MGICLTSQNALGRLGRRTFNMVEISIALLVLGVGLISILGVFPIAANASREAVGMNYGSSASEELLNFVASRGKDNWAVVTAMPDGTLTNISSTSTTITDWTRYLDTGDGNSGIWGLNGDATNSVYRVIVDTSVSGGGTVTAFDGIARVWRTATSGYYYNPSTSTWATSVDSAATRGAQLNVEVSWPATIPYAQRKKSYYSLEVARND